MAKFKVLYAPESLLEIKRIVEWYRNINPALAERFKKNLLAEIEAIKLAPFTRSFRYDNVRFAVIKNSPTQPTTLLMKPRKLLEFMLY